MEVRPAGPDDLPTVAITLAGAFRDDPAWSWVFDDPVRRTAQLEALWTLLLEGSVHYGWVWMTTGAESATLWIPPGMPELDETHAARIGPLFHDLLGPDVHRADALMERFMTAHPATPDHYYLSLFGTRPDCRGRGIGMALLADNLSRIDAEGAPCYLESTNDANLGRYRSVGFADVGAFDLPEGGPTVTTMWRDAR
ncbi:MAG TPA: GNAT family N-acetyltransferase [Acidimicrobiales bacterium]|nr:GNAT family N-acetyltransferase [Acidimicrobiales bacterium]